MIVGTMHTHPNPASEGWATGPSAQDEQAAIFSGVPWLIARKTAITGPVRTAAGEGSAAVPVTHPNGTRRGRKTWQPRVHREQA